jgi:hypothetical protein
VFSAAIDKIERVEFLQRSELKFRSKKNGWAIKDRFAAVPRRK